MLSHNNWEEQIKKYEPKKQRFTIKKLSVGVASVLLGVTFAAGTASADSTTANADSASGSDSAEQTDHNLTLNSTSTSTLKSATAVSQNNSASAAVQNPAGDVKAQAANDYEAAVSAAVANASSDVASDAVQNSSASSVQSSSAADSSAQASAVKSTATQAFSVRSAAVNNFNYASVFASLAAMQQSNNDNAAAQADTNAADSEYSNYKTVTDWSGLQSAISSGAQGVNIKGTINPGWFSNGNLNINGNFTIHGVDGAVLNLGQNYILNNGQLTLDDITLNGAVLGDGTVTIKGTVNSTVTDTATSGSQELQGFANPNRTASGAGAGASADPHGVYSLINTSGYLVNQWQNRKVPNFHAGNLTVDANATLNIRRTATGDGIVLKDGAVTDGLNNITQSTNYGKLNVGNNATLTINLKNSNMSGEEIKSAQNGVKIDNLNAGVRVNTSGSFVTGENAHITMNVGTGRGIVFSERSNTGVANDATNYVSRGESGANGLNATGNDVIGPWVQQNSAIKNTFSLGKNSTFNFVGRDAFMLGNRATFNSGEGSNILVHTYGHGNAIDMGGFSSLNIDSGSTVQFFSEGKNGGGDYHQNNYVALGADGKINVLKDATLRVILTGRGSSDLNDDINIASYGNYDPKIYVGNNATLDVQSDATQGNAELIAIPLPSSNSINFILDNVKYVNLQKTANITATILAPASPDLSSALSKYGYPASRNGYGNLLFMNAGRGQNAHFQAFGDLAAFKWNSALKDNNWTPNLSSNGLQYDPNQSVSKNYQNFENSADQTWSNMYGFDIPYAGFSKTSTGGSVWVDPSGSTAGTNVNSNNGAAFSDLVKGFSPYMSQRLVVIGHSMQPVKEQRTVHYVVQSVDENGNPIETDPTQMREIANPYVQSAQGNNAQSQQLYKDNATDQLVAVERNADGTPKLDANGAVIPIRDSNGNYVSDGDSVNWKNVKGTIVKGSDGHYYFQGYTAPSTISGKDSNGNEVTSLDGGLYKLATAAQLASISNTSQVVKDGKINNSKAFANTQNDFKSGNFYNTYKDGNLYVVYREVNQKANLKIVDSTTGKTLKTYDTAGQTDQAINFANGNVNPATDVENYIKNGYVFEKAINDANPDSALTTKSYSDINFGNFDSDTKTDQSFTVYLKHGLEDVNKDNPHGQKVQATVTRIVNYTVNGQPSDQLPSKTESVDFSATGHWDKVLKQLVDVVDGKILVENGQVEKGSLTWTPESGTLNGYGAPVLAGYHVDSVSAQQGDKNVTTDNVDSTGAVKNVTVNHTDKNINVTVNLVKNAEEKANLKIVDDTTGKTLGTLNAQGDENTPISFTDGASKVAGYLNEGYKFVNVVSDATGKVLSTTDYDAANFGNYDTDPDSDQSFTVHLVHTYAPVNPDHPHKGVNPDQYEKTVNETIHYKYNNGSKAADDNIQTSKWSRTLTLDNVTGKVVPNGEYDKDWSIEPGQPTEYKQVDSPEIKGYTPDQKNIPATAVTQDNIEKFVTYTKNAEEKANLKIVDDTTGKTLNTLNAQGDEDTPITFAGGKSAVQGYLDNGYKFVSVVSDATGNTLSTTDYDAANFGNYDTDPNSDQSFTVHLVHGTKPVNPENPTDKYTKNDLQKTSTRTVNYVDAQGNKIADSVTSTVVFSGSGYVDTVTGNLVNLNNDGSIKDQNGKLTWTYSVDGGKAQSGENYTFAETAAKPTIQHDGVNYRFNNVNPGNYNAGNGAVSSYQVDNSKDNNLNVNVVYNKITYSTKRVNERTVNRTINYLDGKTGEKIPTNLIAGNPVNQSATLYQTQIVDDQGNEKGIGTVNADGTSYTLNNDWHVDGSFDAVTSPDLTKSGYKAPRFENGKSAATVSAETVNENTPKQDTVNVYYDHNEVPVTPDNPHGVDPKQLTKDVNETVHYIVEDGKAKAPADNVQTSKWTRTLTLDEVTKELVPNGQYDTEWAIAKGEKTNYDQVNTPVVKGYYANKANVPATAVTQSNIYTEVTYKPLGHIIPVDPTTGNPIPNAPQPQFPNDPNDPTKGNPGEKPTVPGYHPQDGKPGEPVSPVPGNPGEDVKVPYVKDQGTVSVVFHDDTTNTTIPNVGFNSGDAAADTPVTYNPETNISDLEKQGYVYVRTEGTLPDKVEANKNITVTVHMKHGVQPVTPTTPPTDVPKNTPKEAQPDQLTKKVNLTVNYVNADGTTFNGDVPANAKQTATFTGTAYVDKITGQLVNAKQENGKWVINTDDTATPSITWTSDKTSFEGVTSPAENGYHVSNVSSHADGDNVAAITGLTKDSQDVTVTVTYAKNDTEIKNHQEVKASQVVKYVDENDNELSKTKTQNFTFVYTGDTYDKETGEKIATGKWLAVSHDFSSEDVPTVNGYVAVKGFTRDDNDKVVAGGFTTAYDATDAKRNRVFKVVYKKVGKIVPQLPDGKPVPNVPDVPYTNDPTDPTAVTPDEPTPKDPTGTYTPEVPSVTPEVPTKDTPVVYHANEASLKVQYIDQDDNNAVLHTDSVDGKLGEKLTYTTADEIKSLEGQGYVLVSDGFTGKAGADFTKENNGKTYQVILKHGVQPVTPTTPPTDVPKNTPKEAQPDQLTKKVNLTVNYVNADGTDFTGNVPANAKQTATFTGTAYVDKITGKLVNAKQEDGKWVINTDDTATPEITWTSDKTSFEGVTSPAETGYHVSNVSSHADGDNVAAITGLTKDSQDITVTVTYAKNGTDLENKQHVPASQTVQYVDDQGNTLRPDKSQKFEFNYSGDTVDKVTGETIKQGIWDETSYNFTAENVPVIDGYVAVSGYTNNNGKYTAGGFTATNTGSKENNNRVFKVVYQKVGNIVPQLPDGTPVPNPDKPGENVPNKPYTNDPSNPTDVNPKEPVPNIPGYRPEVPTVTPEVPTKDTPVVYNQIQKADLTIVDQDNGNKQIVVSGVTTKFATDGINGEAITFAGNEAAVKTLENMGYVYVDSDFTSGTKFDGDGATDQHFTITMKHGTQPVNPSTPGKPGEPINPNDPEGPKYPQGSDQVTKNITRTIQYVDENGNQLRNSVEQTVNFTAEGVLDKVTGQWVTPLTWSGSQTVNGVKSPVVEGYHLVSVDRDGEGNNVKGVTLTHENDSYTVTVKYAKNGKIIPVDPTGKPIPNVPTPQYPTDPENPAKVTPDEPVPSIPGYTPEVPTVTPTDPGKDTPVKYTPVDNTQNAQVRYIDLTDDKELANSGNLSGQPGDKINYSTADTIKSLTDKGYVLVNDGFPADAAFDNDKGHDQVFTVTFRHGTQPVNPNEPGKPGQPINPNDPEGPKYPQGSDQVTKNITRTIQYVDENGNQLRNSVEQTVNFTAEGVLDKVTGQWVTPLTWSGSQTVNGVKSPVVEGYHLVSVDRDGEGNNVKGVTLTHENDSYTVTVKYAKNGKIIPVDPTGKPIPNVPTPQYPTDPTDPSKVTPNEPVPSIPGLTPEVPTVTPTDPGKNTPVKYSQTVNATVTYIDDVTGESLKTDSLSGLEGVKSDYSTKSSIDGYEAQGYKVVSDDFPKGGYTFSVEGTHNFTVHLTHTTSPVNPDHPGAGYNKTDLQKDVTRTIYFVNTQDGKQVAEPVNQTVSFTANGTVDNVTGKLVTVADGKITGPGELTWTPAQDVKGVQSPAVNGMHVTFVTRDADGTNVKGVSLTHDDSSYDVYVNYAPNGTTNEHGQNIPASQTIKFVDENGNTLRENNVQTSEFVRTPDVVDAFTGKTITEGSWKETSHKFGVIDVPVIDGYVATVKTAGGLTATTDNPNVVTEVVYKKVGKIIPVDPTGKPIPNVPTPEYPNDPTDPTKVTPNEPVPTIPGYTPETPTVTPEVPTKDTPVKYTPVDNTQNAQVRYIDLTNNEEIANSGNLSGQPGDKINYSTADTIKSLTDKGYVLVNDGFPADAAFDNDKGHDQVFTVTFRHGTQPVNPNEPGKPGQPINPNDPEGPKYPQGSDQVTKNVTRTVQYVDENGNKISDPVEQTVNFTAEGVLDKVTGQWVTPLTWSGSQSVAGVKTPVVEGYHVVNVDRDGDGVNVKGVTLTHENDNYTVTVQYAKNGKIVPVDPTGKPIPNVPTPQYPTDPENPAKVTPDEPVPSIPGFVPEVPTVTPTDPGKDTPVHYTPVVNDQNAVVNYVDQDNNNAQIATSGNLTGKPGSLIDYSTAATIKQLEDQGYVLVSNGFPAGAVFDNDDNTTQTYTVVLKHGTTTFKPDKPGTPGEPINPNYPEGPKVTNEDVDYSKDVKFTVHYVGAGSNNPADNVQNAQWTRAITVDNVTGKIISSTEWVSNKDSYSNVATPVVEGYHADRAQVDGQKVTMEDQEATVTYVPNGKIVPVDPTGKPIPNVPTPQYPTDPTDPTKVTPDEPVPTIPNYTPEVPTVTPTDPGVDTPVKYTPNTVNPKPAVDQIAVVNYVDQDNNNAQIATSGNLTGKAGSVINYSTADQIKQLEARGYVLVTDGFPAGATFDDNADQNQVFTVVLKHGHAPVGPKNPEEPGTPVNPGYPEGPKWPAKDNYSKDYTSTVHFVDNNGNKMRDDNVQTSTWTRTLIIDKVTGQILNPNENWTSDKASYNEVKVPVINGYVADKANVPAKEAVQQNIEDTVTYTKVGNIVPVDPSGNRIPNVPVVPYTNDPTDPTKVVPNEPVPSVPGMTPNVTTVTPDHPTVDTPVVYTTPTPVTPQTPATPEPETPAEPARPAETPAQPAAPEAPAAPKAATPAKATPAAKQEAKKLPQTGNENSSSAAALGLAALGLTGLLAAGKKRRKED